MNETIGNAREKTAKVECQSARGQAIPRNEHLMEKMGAKIIDSFDQFRIDLVCGVSWWNKDMGVCMAGAARLRARTLEGLGL